MRPQNGLRLMCAVLGTEGVCNAREFTQRARVCGNSRLAQTVQMLQRFYGQSDRGMLAPQTLEQGSVGRTVCMFGGDHLVNPSKIRIHHWFAGARDILAYDLAAAR